MASKGGKVTEREIARMLELHKKGYTFKAIGKKLRRDPDTVSRYVKLRMTMKQVQNFYENADEKDYVIHESLMDKPEPEYLVLENDKGEPVLAKIIHEKL